MKKSLLLLPLIALLIGCDGNGGNGKTIVRIDGKAFTEEDFETRLSNMPEDQLQQVLKDPEQRRANFDVILHSRLYSMAGQQETYANRDSIERRLSLFDQRVVTQYYYSSYISEYDMHSRKQVEAYYNANTSKFTDDSGRVIPFYRIAGRVADSLLISESNLDSFYVANKVTYTQKAYCNVSYIQAAKRKDADAAIKALQGGTQFGEVAKKYSTHISKNNGGNIGRITQGVGYPDIGATPLVDSLLFDPNGKVKTGEVSSPIANDTTFVLVRPDSCHDEMFAPLNSHRSQVAADYIRQFKEKHTETAVEDLKAKYQVKLVSPFKPVTENEIKAYYDQNKDAYQSPEGFELYDIEVANKDKVLKAFKAVKDLAGFKVLASQVSENPLTKPQAGYLGLVRRDFCLPYGIGMFPALFDELDKISQGKVNDPLQNPDTQKWHFFWLVKKEPAAQKPLERVRALVKADVSANHVTNIMPGDELAVFGDGKKIHESDVIFLRAEIPPSMQDRYTRESLVNFLLTWQLAYDESKALGLTDERKLVAARLQNEDDFWGRVYQDSVLSRSYEEDPTLLAQTFSQKHAVFTADTSDHNWHNHAHDIAAYLTLTPQDFNIEYYTNPERYKHDTTLQELSTVMDQVFNNLKPVAYQRLDKKIFETLKKRFDVKIVDESLNEPSLEPAAESYKRAQSLHYDRKLDKALELYGKLRDQFPDRADLQDSISFGLAQIYLEQEKYPQAMAEYRRVSYLYPNSANNYKAMFMVGFIYSEHLKNDSAAVRSFESMLQKYPKTDLSDDADWMIRNIRSGGKLMPKLETDTTSSDKSKK